MQRAREIALKLIEEGMDRYFLRFLVMRVREEVGVRQERLHDARARRHIQAAAAHLDKARAALVRIEQLAFVADAVGGAVLDWLCRHIDEVVASLPALGGKPMPRGRPGEDHITRFMFILSEDLRERTGRPHWREIAEFVNNLGLEQHLTPRYVQTRCIRYRDVERNALQKARQEARKFWVGAEDNTV